MERVVTIRIEKHSWLAPRPEYVIASKFFSGPRHAVFSVQRVQTRLVTFRHHLPVSLAPKPDYVIDWNFPGELCSLQCIYTPAGLVTFRHHLSVSLAANCLFHWISITSFIWRCSHWTSTISFICRRSHWSIYFHRCVHIWHWYYYGIICALTLLPHQLCFLLDLHRLMHHPAAFSLVPLWSPHRVCV